MQHMEAKYIIRRCSNEFYHMNHLASVRHLEIISDLFVNRLSLSNQLLCCYNIRFCTSLKVTIFTLCDRKQSLLQENFNY